MIQLAHGFDGLQSLCGSHATPFDTLRLLPFLVGSEGGHDSLKPWLLSHASKHTTAKRNEKASGSSQVNKLLQVEDRQGQAVPGSGFGGGGAEGFAELTGFGFEANQFGAQGFHPVAFRGR